MKNYHTKKEDYEKKMNEYSLKTSPKLPAKWGEKDFEYRHILKLLKKEYTLYDNKNQLLISKPNGLNLFYRKYQDLKKQYSLNDRWYGYTSMVENLIELGNYELAINEWNFLMEEEWDGFKMRWTYHDFHIPYLLRFEFKTKRSVLTGHNVIRMGGWKNLTKYGLDHIIEIEKSIDSLIIKEKSFFNLIWRSYDFDVDYHNSVTLKKEVGHTFAVFHEKCLKISEELGRSAENYLRKNRGVPMIGEGWVSETDLYYKIKEELKVYEVIHHGRPKWLGRQHLDIWIPNLKIAIEYQGAQHYKPVEFFGGEDAFRMNQKRDKRKKKLCEENKVILIEVREGYDIEEVIQRIKSFI